MSDLWGMWLGGFLCGVGLTLFITLPSFLEAVIR